MCFYSKFEESAALSTFCVCWNVCGLNLVSGKFQDLCQISSHVYYCKYLLVKFGFLFHLVGHGHFLKMFKTFIKKQNNIANVNVSSLKKISFIELVLLVKCFNQSILHSLLDIIHEKMPNSSPLCFHVLHLAKDEKWIDKHIVLPTAILQKRELNNV